MAETIWLINARCIYLKNRDKNVCQIYKKELSRAHLFECDLFNIKLNVSNIRQHLQRENIRQHNQKDFLVTLSSLPILINEIDNGLFSEFRYKKNKPITLDEKRRIKINLVKQTPHSRL